MTIANDQGPPRQGPPPRQERAPIQKTGTPSDLTFPVLDLTTDPLPLRWALSHGQQQRARKLA
jgi:hypothetical protein